MKNIFYKTSSGYVLFKEDSITVNGVVVQNTDKKFPILMSLLLLAKMKNRTMVDMVNMMSTAI